MSPPEHLLYFEMEMTNAVSDTIHVGVVLTDFWKEEDDLHAYFDTINDMRYVPVMYTFSEAFVHRGDERGAPLTADAPSSSVPSPRQWGGGCPPVNISVNFFS